MIMLLVYNNKNNNNNNNNNNNILSGINYINYSSHGIVFTLGEKGGGVLTFQMIAREQRNIFVCT